MNNPISAVSRRDCFRMEFNFRQPWTAFTRTSRASDETGFDGMASGAVDESTVETIKRGHLQSKADLAGCRNVGQASSLTVHGASVPRVSSGRMPPEPADRMSAPHFQTGSKPVHGNSHSTRMDVSIRVGFLNFQKDLTRAYPSRCRHERPSGDSRGPGSGR